MKIFVISRNTRKDVVSMDRMVMINLCLINIQNNINVLITAEKKAICRRGVFYEPGNT
ncbi:MAG: hypothetical protein NT010_01505 [Proteobacteria bacterium]|nr:hypothetical protein [Pseudomonadota bacterium]